MGFEGTNANTDCVFVDVKRSAKEFGDTCAAQKVRHLGATLILLAGAAYPTRKGC